jgi:uncharacterized protein (DUF1684 family)
MVGRSLLVLTLLAASCAAPDVSMVRVSPPRGWERALIHERAERERFFRASPETPLPPAHVAAFPGLDHWPPDPDFYFVGQIEFYTEPETIEIGTTSGKTRPAERVGRVRFEVDGSPRELQVYRLTDVEPAESWSNLLLPFRDRTTGSQTYPAGRYVDLAGPSQGPWVLDFNAAYNPSCAYGDAQRFACPMAPRENWLEVAIAAGERGWFPRVGS